MTLTQDKYQHSGSGAVNRTVESKLAETVSVTDFMTDAERVGIVAGTVDVTAAIQDALDYISTYGGTLLFPPGSYLASTELTTLYTNIQFEIVGYGAEILTTGAIAGLKITGGSSTTGRTIRGLTINHRNNTTATDGFLIEKAWNTRFYDCTVIANNPASGYAGFHVQQSDSTDSATGSFWTSFNNCWVRKLSGGDTGTIPNGIVLEGASNATNIINCGINNAVNGITLKNHTTESVSPNGVLISACAFEGYTTAINLEFDTDFNVTYPRVIGNRFENGTNIYSITGSTVTSPGFPLMLSNNYYVSGAFSTFGVNASSIYVNIDEFVTTPATPQNSASSSNGFRFRTITAGEGVELIPAGGSNAGFNIWDGGAAAKRVWMNYTGGSNGEVAALGNMEFFTYPNVKVMSGSGTPEGNDSAGIGSLYTRLDGGAGTTLYVKESGTGNTGWVAK